MASLDDPFRETLEQVASLDPQWHSARFGAALATGGGRFVLFGAGQLARALVPRLKKLGLEPSAFLDNNPDLWDTRWGGIPILAPAEGLRQFGPSVLVIASMRHPGFFFPAFAAQARTQGLVNLLPVQAVHLAFPGEFLPFYFWDEPRHLIPQLPRIARAFGVLGDERSRREFLGQVRYRAFLDPLGMPEPDRANQYFPPGLIGPIPAQEVFLDCGAFTGDTLREFLERAPEGFRGYTAVEADPANLPRLHRTIASLEAGVRSRVQVLPFAVGREDGTVRFSSRGDGDSCISAQGDVEVPCRALDGILGDPPPTFVKMDIEGAELLALEGAAATLRRARPVMAVCIYHAPSHLWDVPLWIHRHLPGHTLHIRAHEHEGWEMVCYALPPDRGPRDPRI